MENLQKELFYKVSKSEKDAETIVRPSMTFWQDAWRRLKMNKVAMVSLWAIVIMFLIALIGPLVMPYTYDQQIRGHEDLGPSIKHFFGTDSLGRDLFVRCLYGMRISLAIGIVATIINIIIGVLYGGISGFFGGKVDNIMMRIVDILYSVPLMIYVILLSVSLKPTLSALFEKYEFLSGLRAVGAPLVCMFIAIGLTYWISMARIVRGEILSLKQQEYVTAAKTIGASGWRILIRHLIPNTIGSIIVTSTLQIPSAIFTESFLSFIGLGVDAPASSLGSLASDGLNGFISYPYRLFFPSLLICLIILAFNLFGDGLRDALDPRMRK
ncbi:ABC transporter permease [Caldicellulosiruptoraceae bacterium PP1]